jgi:hypothetical protein
MSESARKLIETLNKQAKTIRQRLALGCCENWNSSFPCDKECDEPVVSVETVTALLTQVCKELDEANLLCELQASRISGLETFKKQQTEKEQELSGYLSSPREGVDLSEKVLVDRQKLSDSLDRLAEDCHDKIVDELKFPAHHRHSGWAKVLQPIIWGWFEKLIHDSEKGSLGDKS